MVLLGMGPGETETTFGQALPQDAVRHGAGQTVVQFVRAGTMEHNADIAMTVVATMRQLGVIGLPRNYEIFYEALTGTNNALSLDVIELGNRPSQNDLDKIGQRYFASNHTQTVVEQAREILASELESVSMLLRSEKSHLEKYGRILDESASGIQTQKIISKELLQKLLGVMKVATDSTIDHGQQVATALGEKSAELESVKSKLEEYKKLADTDPLTQIANRRAFDKRISSIYNSQKGVMFGALVLADIDHFKDINDRHGHPVGDKIIQIIANIFLSETRQDMFVARTGGEEFALIVDGCTEDVTFEIADRVRQLVETTPLTDVTTGARLEPVTISLGICMASEADSAADLYAKADKALYRSKVAGRNRVTRYSALSELQGKNWFLYRRD